MLKISAVIPSTHEVVREFIIHGDVMIPFGVNSSGRDRTQVWVHEPSLEVGDGSHRYSPELLYTDSIVIHGKAEVSCRTVKKAIE